MNKSALQARTAKTLGFRRGALDMLPLSIAVIPWGILAGSTAIQAGLSLMQAAGMSALVFAGAAQLVSLSMLNAGVSAAAIAITVFFITSQHYIYALHLRKDAASLPVLQRLLLGFLLTDELYATAMLQHQRPYRYLLGAGLSFYLSWQLFSWIGIYLARKVPDLHAFHLDFSIAAVFLVMGVMQLQSKAAIAGGISAALMSVLFTELHMHAGILLAGLCGMAVAAICDKAGEKA
ncbi:MAG: AzlC family ABC transporter permease [Acinetobacter sp.]